MKKYKILIISSFDRPWDDGWYYKSGFEKNGHSVTVFDPSEKKEPEQDVFEVVKDIGPDFILHTKDELQPEVYQKLRNETRVIQWYPDVTIHDWLPAYVRASDIFFTMSEGLVDELRNYNNNVFWMTQAFDPFSFKLNEVTPQEANTYSADVTFVGSLGMKPFYRKRRELLQRVVREGYSVKWWGPGLPRKLSTIPFILGGLGRSYGGRTVWGEEHAKIARLSKIYLGVDAMPHIRKSMSERLYIAVGCGAFYMCEHVEGIEEVLVPDKEIVTFRSEEEMLDKISYYLDRDEERSVISDAGRQKVLKDHTYQVRLKQMISLVEEKDIL